MSNFPEHLDPSVLRGLLSPRITRRAALQAGAIAGAASLLLPDAADAAVGDTASVKFGMQETPWLAFEESINRYRAQGTFFAERTGLIPGPADLGASLKASTGATEVQVGVYNGEGYGHAELDKYKSLQGRATFRPYYDEAEHVAVRLTGFYSYGWYAKDRPRNVALVKIGRAHV